MPNANRAETVSCVFAPFEAERYHHCQHNSAAMAQSLTVANAIDAQPIGSFQWRVFALCGAVLFVDGFDVQGITYVAPAISQTWSLPRGALGPTFSAGLFGVMLGPCCSRRWRIASAGAA